MHHFLCVLRGRHRDLSWLLFHKVEQRLHFLAGEVEHWIQVIHHTVLEQRVTKSRYTPAIFHTYNWTMLLMRVLRLTRHPLLGDLPVVDLLLQGVVAHQAVDVAELLLTVAVHPAHSLGVVTGVPGGVEDDHAVGADQVHPQAAGPVDV